MSRWFTVVGFWSDTDDPVVTAVIELVGGGQMIIGGGQECSEGGPWALEVEAVDMESAEPIAVKEMLATLPPDENDPDQSDRYPRKALLPLRLYYCAPSEDYFYTPDGVGLIWFESKAQALREVGNFGKPIITIHTYPED